MDEDIIDSQMKHCIQQMTIYNIDFRIRKKNYCTVLKVRASA